MRLRLFRAALFASTFAISPSVHAGRGAAPASRRPTILDPDGNVVEWQSAAEVVIDLYPATDSVFASGSQKLFWHAADRAKSYRVQLSTDGDYRDNLIDRTTSDLSVTTGPLRPGRYYWHVQSIDSLGTPAAWSTTNDFEIRTGETGAKATLHWRPPTWTSSHFIVRIARDAKMTSIAEQKATENAFFVSQPLPKGHYWWRVETLDEDGKHLDWTPIESFTVGDGGIVSYEGGP